MKSGDKRMLKIYLYFQLFSRYKKSWQYVARRKSSILHLRNGSRLKEVFDIKYASKVNGNLAQQVSCFYSIINLFLSYTLLKAFYECSIKLIEFLVATF
uniref:Ovule protein n=1 Tax=Strongyloides stercoralis TaxID=6248 RepID=A0A0K0E9M1_STRER